MLVHETTNPDFLEKHSKSPPPNSHPYQSPNQTKNQKLSLKRRELRKLEKLRGESAELNLFLRKYYNDCLPKLPPEEEGGESPPEEKSLLASFLDQLARTMRRWEKGQVKYCQSRYSGTSLSSTPTSSSTTSDSEFSSNLTEGESESDPPVWGLGRDVDFLPMIPEDPAEVSSSDTNRTKERNQPAPQENRSQRPLTNGPANGPMKITKPHQAQRREWEGGNGDGDEDSFAFESPPRADRRFPSNSTPDIQNYSPGENYENHFFPFTSSTPQTPGRPGLSPNVKTSGKKKKRQARRGGVAVGVGLRRNMKTPSTKTGQSPPSASHLIIHNISTSLLFHSSYFKTKQKFAILVVMDFTQGWVKCWSGVSGMETPPSHLKVRSTRGNKAEGG